MDPPAARGAWPARVKAWAAAYRSLAEAHPNLVLQIVSDPGAVAIAAVQANETLYAALDASGMPPRDVLRAADLVVDYVNGFVLGAVAQAQLGADAVEAFRAELDAQPESTVAVQRRLFAAADTDPTPRDSFTFGLDVILAGLAERTPEER